MEIWLAQIRSGAQKASMVVAAIAVAAKAIPLTADIQSVFMVTASKDPSFLIARISELLSLPPYLLLPD